MELISYVTLDQESAIERLNLAYLLLAREALPHRVGRDAMGLEHNPDLCKRLVELSSAQAHRAAKCGFPLVGLRVDARQLSAMIESPTSTTPAKNSFSYVTAMQDALIQRLNADYLMIARDVGVHQVGRMIMGLEGDAALWRRLVSLTNTEIRRVIVFALPLVGLRINERLLGMMTEVNRSQNVDAFSFLQTLGDKSAVTSPITQIQGS